MTLNLDGSAEMLVVTIYDHDSFDSDDFLGQLLLPLSEAPVWEQVVAEADASLNLLCFPRELTQSLQSSVDQWFPLLGKTSDDTAQHGELHLRIAFKQVILKTIQDVESV